MNWALVPLMVGSIVLGWLGWTGWLPNVLAGPLGGVEPQAALLSPTGGLAFILGAIGFLGAAWYVQRPSAALAPTETTYRADAWVRVIATGGYAVSAAFSRLQSGLLARYAFGSVVAVAIILLVRVSIR
jgi:hypothetical protein